MKTTSQTLKFEALSCIIETTPAERRVCVDVLEVVSALSMRDDDGEVVESGFGSYLCYTVVEIDNAIDLLVDAGILVSSVRRCGDRFAPTVRFADVHCHLAAA